MASLLLPGCVDCNDSLSVLARDVCGRNDAAIPAATSLSPSRRLMWPSELPAGVVATSFSFIQVDDSHCSTSVDFYDGLCKRLRHGCCGRIESPRNDPLSHQFRRCSRARHTPLAGGSP